MTRKTSMIWSSAMLLMALTGVILARLSSHRTLGAPGVKTSTIPNSIRLNVDLPEFVSNCTSKSIETDKLVLETLPSDTSFGQRWYSATNDNFQPQLSVVLMGRDRSSIHKPQFCLEGAGWHIDQSLTLRTTVHVQRPVVYELPVVRLITTKELLHEGRRVIVRGIFVYWYVSDGELSASVSGFERMWKMSCRLLSTGVWQRWAYVTCGAACQPGQEETTFEKLKGFIAEAAPEFQLTSNSSLQLTNAR